MPNLIIFKPRRGNKSLMSTSKKVLEAGELFLEYPDSGVGTGSCNIKIGDGKTQYQSLPYALNINTIEANIASLQAEIKTKQPVGYYATASELSGTIDDLYNKRKGTSGGVGSISLTKKSSGVGSEIPAGWYNYFYSPHRTGVGGDNTDYATVILTPMTFKGTSYIVRFTSKAIADVKTIITDKPSDATITIKQSGREDQTFTLNGGATTITLDNDNSTYNFAGADFMSGNQSNGTHNADEMMNGVYYYTNNGPRTNIGATTNDGAIYSQAHSDAWRGQIAQDYRNGMLYVRGKNNGAWTAWRRIMPQDEVAGTKVNNAGHADTADKTTGNAGSATRLQTTRKINNTNFNGTADITTALWGTARNITIGKTTKSVNGSQNMSWSIQEMGVSPDDHTHLYAGSQTVGGTANSAETLQKVSANGGNTNNYSYHRFAYINGITGQWSDTDSIFLIRQKFDGGNMGIVKVSMRTNSTGNGVSVSCTWLVRHGWAADAVQFGRYGVTGNSCYADIFLKTPGSYPRTEITRLTSLDNRWFMCDSNEVNDTTTSDRKTSTECYSSTGDAATRLHNSTAYTATGVSKDGGTVYYADNAGEASHAARATNSDNATNSTNAGTANYAKNVVEGIVIDCGDEA